MVGQDAEEKTTNRANGFARFVVFPLFRQPVTLNLMALLPKPLTVPGSGSLPQEGVTKVHPWAVAVRKRNSVISHCPHFQSLTASEGAYRRPPPRGVGYGPHALGHRSILADPTFSKDARHSQCAGKIPRTLSSLCPGHHKKARHTQQYRQWYKGCPQRRQKWSGEQS